MSDTTTRSGMLWEVERILTECKQKPQILLMENVPQVHSQDNIEDFNKWQYSLEKMGYSNYWQDLIATDYGIPQTRNRCFMISILGDYNYTFPKPIPLKLKLKDMLEDKVNDKYYLSEKMLKYITSKDDKYKVNENNLINNQRLKTTLENNNIDETCYIDCYNQKIDNEKVGSITTRIDASNNTFIAIKNNTKKGYLEAKDGDCIDLCQPNSKTRRGRVQKEKSQTITTMGGEHLGVVINE